jgi:hypothetical protein
VAKADVDVDDTVVEEVIDGVGVDVGIVVDGVNVNAGGVGGSLLLLLPVPVLPAVSSPVFLPVSASVVDS